jgi:hypothetical protein
VDRVGIIISYEWRAYWRRFAGARLRAGNQGILFLVSALLAIKYLQLLLTASANVAKGNPGLVQTLLAAIFIVWMFPLAGSARNTLASREWLYLPLSLSERFMVRAISLLMPPSAWLVFAGSLAICYPLARAHNPLAGIAAGLLFIVTAWLTGLTVTCLLNRAAWRRSFWIAALALLVLSGIYVFRGNAAASLIAFTFSPAGLVTRAAMEAGTAPLISLAMLATLSVVAGAAALWSFKMSLDTAGESPDKRTPILSNYILPGRIGGLVTKDFRYFRRLLDIYLGLAAAMLGCLYLVFANAPSVGVFWSFIVVVLLCNAALAFNSFGLDNRAGSDRYTLLPLSGRAILVSKNLAYLMICGMQIIPLLLVASWRLGIVASLLGLVETSTLASAYLAWGNWMSVNHPLKMQFFRFANSGAALVDAMGGIIFGSLPGLVMIYLWLRPEGGAARGIVLLLLLTSMLYVLSVRRYGGRLEQKRELIAEALG